MPEERHLLAGLLAIFLAGHLVFIASGFVLHYFDRAGNDPAATFPVRSYLRVFLREWWYSLGATLLYPFGLLPHFGGRSYQPQGGPPIVLLHGYAMNRTCMFAIYWRLRRRGFRNIYPVDLKPMFGSIPTVGERLGAELRNISREADGQSVICIAHSMGGIVARWCAQHVEQVPIAKIITIGTPHRGTRMAVLAPGKNARQMRPGSSFLGELDDDIAPPVVSLYSMIDNLVIPSHHAAFGERSLEFNNCGHITLLFDADLFDWLAAELSEGR